MNFHGRGTDQSLLEGSEESRRQSREQLERERRLWVAQKAGWPEIPRRHLKFGRHGHVEDETDGRFYSRYRGEVDAVYCAVVAYYVDEHGHPVFLEPPPGPKTRTELEAREADREQRRNTPKPRPGVTR